jgi:hypothetical protein
LQQQVDDEQQARQHLIEQHQLAEKRAHTAQQEKDDLANVLSQADKLRMKADHDAQEARDQAQHLEAVNGTLAAQKRKLENDVMVSQPDNAFCY